MNGFVADEHISLATIKLLRGAGFRVFSIREEAPGLDDEGILRLADQEKLVVITCDRDFSDLIYKQKVAFNAGLIYCRIRHIMPSEIAELIVYHINEFGAEFEGRMTILGKGKFRQRDL